jgi:guanidinopropionase
MRSTHHLFRINPFELCRVADVGDVRFNSLFDNATAQKDIEAFYRRIARAGVTPVSVGGDHGVTYPILQ